MATTAQPVEADRFSLLGRKRSRAACGSGGSRPAAAKFTAAIAKAVNCKQEWTEELPPPPPSPRGAPHTPTPQQQCAIRVVHIFAPRVIQTNVEDFRALVQKLTGLKASKGGSVRQHHSFKKPCSSSGSGARDLPPQPDAAAAALPVDAPAAKKAKLEMVTDDDSCYGSSSASFRSSSGSSPSHSHSLLSQPQLATAGVTIASDSSCCPEYRFPAFQGNHIARRSGYGQAAPLGTEDILDMDAPIAHCRDRLGAAANVFCYPQQQQQVLQHQDSLASSANSGGFFYDMCPRVAPLLPSNLFASCAVASQHGYHHLAEQQQQQPLFSYNSSGGSGSGSGSSSLLECMSSNSNSSLDFGGFHPAANSLQGLLMSSTTADAAASLGLGLNWVQEAAINMIAEAVQIRSSGLVGALPPFPGDLGDTDILAELWGSLGPDFAMPPPPTASQQLCRRTAAFNLPTEQL